MDLRDVFAVNLRRIRLAKGLSQEQTAYDSGISRGYYSQIELGKFFVSIKIIGKLAKTLDTEPAEFLKIPAKRRPSR
jgi:transcriptional regulator with XRE-family HTH domain